MALRHAGCIVVVGRLVSSLSDFLPSSQVLVRTCFKHGIHAKRRTIMYASGAVKLMALLFLASVATAWTNEMVEFGLRRASPSSLTSMVKKLRAGFPITVATFGSSVSEYTHGVFASSVHAFLGSGAHRLSRIWDTAVSHHVCSPDEAAPCVTNGSVTNLMHHSNRSWPHINNTLVNLGISGGGLVSIVGSCFEAYLPFSADLLIFESSGGREGGTGPTKGEAANPAPISEFYHLLMHKFGALVPIPVVLMHYPWVMQLNNACTPSYNFSFKTLFGGTEIDDMSSTLASYYDFCVLSLRDARWAGLRSGAPRAESHRE